MTMTLYERNNTVVWKSNFDITVSCPMSFTSFPFDKQTCSLQMRLPEIMTPRLLHFDLKDSLKDTLGYNVQVYLTFIALVVFFIPKKGFAIECKVGFCGS